MPRDDDETDGQRLASKLAALSSGSFAGAPTDTAVDALPAGARQIPIRELVRDRQASADLEHVRDLVMPENPKSLDTLRQGAPPVDINATIATKEDAQSAQLVRDHALDAERELDQLETIRRPSGSEAPRPVDVNATIVTQHARTVAEQERDLAFKKLRDGTADELRSERKPRLSSGSDASARRHTTTDGLPLLKSNPLEIRGERTRPDEDSGITTHVTGNEMRGTINRRGDDGRRQWWQRWQYLVPLGALAATAGIALVVMRSAGRVPHQATLTAPRDAGAPREPAIREPAPTLWLDGKAFEIDEIDTTALDEIEPDPDTVLDDVLAVESADDEILPALDLTWLDALDDNALARAENWLVGKQP